MPIKIPNELPAVQTLTDENIFVMTETRAITQDIRPLRILLLNLMPTKIDTETQISRLLSNSPLQVELELIHMRTHKSKNTSPEHLLAFYKTFDQVKHEKFDGLIITGAPVEKMPFEEVTYWDELCEIMEWSKKNVHSTFHICWGAQAGLYYHYGVNKHPLKEKMFGVFEHTADYRECTLLRGFDGVLCLFGVVAHLNHALCRPDLPLQLTQQLVQAGLHVLGLHHQRHVVDAAGQVFHGHVVDDAHARVLCIVAGTYLATYYHTDAVAPEAFGKLKRIVGSGGSHTVHAAFHTDGYIDCFQC